MRLQTLRAIQLPSEATGAVAINAFIYIINFIIIYTVFYHYLLNFIVNNSAIFDTFIINFTIIFNTLSAATNCYNIAFGNHFCTLFKKYKRNDNLQSPVARWGRIYNEPLHKTTKQLHSIATPQVALFLIIKQL